MDNASSRSMCFAKIEELLRARARIGTQNLLSCSALGDWRNNPNSQTRSTLNTTQ